MLLWAYPRKTQSTVFGPNLRFFGTVILTFAKHPQVRRQESDGFLPFHISYRVWSWFLLGTLFRTWHEVNTAYPHHALERPAVSNMELTKLVTVRHFLSAFPFDSGELGGVLSLIIPCSSQNLSNILGKYSPPRSDLRHLIFLKLILNFSFIDFKVV